MLNKINNVKELEAFSKAKNVADANYLDCGVFHVTSPAGLFILNNEGYGEIFAVINSKQEFVPYEYILHQQKKAVEYVTMGEFEKAIKIFDKLKNFIWFDNTAFVVIELNEKGKKEGGYHGKYNPACNIAIS